MTKEEIKFLTVKSIISNCICKSVAIAQKNNGLINETILNNISNETVDEILAELKEIEIADPIVV